jgi:hypothetical protein
MTLDGSSPDTTSLVHGHLSRIMQALHRTSSVAYMLSSEFRIMYFNPAWKRFAEANGAPNSGGTLTGSSAGMSLSGSVLIAVSHLRNCISNSKRSILSLWVTISRLSRP